MAQGNPQRKCAHSAVTAVPPRRVILSGMPTYLLTAARRDQRGDITRVVWYRYPNVAALIEAGVHEVIDALRRNNRVRVEVGFMMSRHVGIASDGKGIDGWAGDNSALGLADLPAF